MSLLNAQLLGVVCTCLETKFFVRIFVRIFKRLLNQEHHDSTGKVPFSQYSREDFREDFHEDFHEDFRDAIESGPRS